MKIADVMTRKVEFVSGDATVRDAAMRMAEFDIGAILVGSEDSLDGILTDRDILLRVVIEGRDPAAVTVREVMSATVFTCQANDPLDVAFQEMQERQVRRLPVLDDDRLVGIVVLSDLAARTGETQNVEALRAIAEPHRHGTVPQPETPARGDQ